MDTSPLAQVSVLVVDDDRDMRTFVEFVLLDAGALVHTASRADEARQAVRVAVPDVAVIDLDLPRRGAYRLQETLHALAPPRRPHVVGTMAQAASDQRARALRAGFEAVVTVPCGRGELVSTVAALVSSAPAPARPGQRAGGPTRRELFERAVGLLVARSGQGVCVGCLGAALGAPSKRMQETLVKIEARRGFVRGFGQCATCGKARLVLRYLRDRDA
jgi:CheY-like chemotaxis protein